MSHFTVVDDDEYARMTGLIDKLSEALEIAKEWIASRQSCAGEEVLLEIEQILESE